MCPINIKELSQGDIISGGRLFFQINELQSLDRSDDGSLRIVAARELDKVEQISLFPSVSCDLAVLSQTCDVRKEDVPTIIVAPVLPLAIGGAKTCVQRLDQSLHEFCRNYKLIYAYYLPPTASSGVDYPESYVDVRYASTLAKNVLNSFEIACALPSGHDNQFRIFIQNAFAREGFPNEIVAALGKVPNEFRDSKNRALVHEFYIKWDDSNILLLAVLHEHDTVVETRFKRAVEKTNKMGLGYIIHLSISVKTETTLADIEHYKRFAWDNLSFTEGTATDAHGVAVPFLNNPL